MYVTFYDQVVVNNVNGYENGTNEWRQLNMMYAVKMVNNRYGESIDRKQLV